MVHNVRIILYILYTCRRGVYKKETGVPFIEMLVAICEEGNMLLLCRAKDDGIPGI